MITACYTVYEEQNLIEKAPSPMTIEIDIVLPNGVTIYRSSKQAVDHLYCFITKYNSIWYDKGFAKLLVENWIQILLKSDWESKVSRKAKVYLLSVKDRKLVDQTFDKLHELRRMSWSKNATFFSYPVFYV